MLRKLQSFDHKKIITGFTAIQWKKNMTENDGIKTFDKI